MKKIFLYILLLILFFFGMYSLNKQRKIEKHTVLLTESGFIPKNLVIKKGDVVIFRTSLLQRFWPASDLHPLHDIYSDFDPKRSLDHTEEWSFKFNKVGVWKYHDHLFPYYRGVVEVLSTARGSQVDESNDMAYKEIILRVKNIFNRNTPELAYSKLTEEFGSYNAATSHTAMHVFGEMLFVKMREGGIVVCEADFGFGCFHGFISKAIAEGGVDSALRIDKFCLEKYGEMGLGCPHGIGHGLGEFFGPKRINEQLEVCSMLSWKGALLGCSSGVFMEHNTPSSFLGDEISVENYYKEQKPDFLCDKVISTYKDSCYFELPQSWMMVEKVDSLMMGRWCSESSAHSGKNFCFMGIGYALSVSDQNLNDVKEKCSKTSGNSLEVAYCYSGIAWGLFSDPITRESVDVVCGDLAGEQRKICSNYQILLTHRDN